MKIILKTTVAMLVLAGILAPPALAEVENKADLSKTSETISKKMEEIAKISSQTSTASRQTAEAMQDMARLFEKLRVSVETFKLGDQKEDLVILDKAV